MSDDIDRPPPDEPGGGSAPDETAGVDADASGTDDADATAAADAPAPPATARVEYDDETLSRLCEAILFVSQRPVPVPQLARTVRTTYAAVRRAMKLVQARFEGHGIELAEIAGAWQLRTAAECGPTVQKFLDAKPIRLSKAAVEALAVIAYRQPVTKPEVDEIRGVDSGSAVKLLMDRNLIKILGKKEEPGRPLLYGTTAGFLEFFGLKSLTDLPSLRDMADLTEESRRQLERDLFARAPDAASADHLSDAPRRHWDDLQEVLGADLGELPEGVEVIPEDGTAIEEFLRMTGGFPEEGPSAAAGDSPAEPEETGEDAGDEGNGDGGETEEER